MAASKDLSSLTWVLDKVKFSSALVDSFLTKDSLMDCIAEEHVIPVFRGILQLNYWKRKLGKGLDKRTVLMACLGPAGLLKPDICQLYEIIEHITGEEEIISVYYSENNNIVGFNFKSAEAATKVQQEVTNAGEALVCIINIAPSNFCDVRVLWAPAFCPISLISQIFETYATDIELAFEKVRVKAGRSLPSNIAVGKILLKDGITIGDIPHIVKLPDCNRNYVMIVFKDRPPLCLKCRGVGHMRRQCTLSFCMHCKRQHEKGIGCIGFSYARAASKTGVSFGPVLENTDMFMDADEVIEKESVSKSNNSGCDSNYEKFSKVGEKKNLELESGTLIDGPSGLDLSPFNTNISPRDGQEWMQVTGPTGRKVNSILPSVSSASMNLIKPDYYAANNLFSLLEDSLDQRDDIVNRPGAEVMMSEEDGEVKDKDVQKNVSQLVSDPLPNQVMCKEGVKKEKGIKRLRVNDQELDCKKTKEGDVRHESAEVITRAAAKALLAGSNEVECIVGDQKKINGAGNDEAMVKAPDIGRVVVIVKTTGEDDLSDENESSDNTHNDEDDDDSDYNSPSITFPTDYTCFDCGTVLKVLSQPTENFPCTGCPRQYAYDSERGVIYQRTALQSDFIKRDVPT